jgi:uncharacterized membrane protein
MNPDPLSPEPEIPQGDPGASPTEPPAEPVILPIPQEASQPASTPTSPPRREQVHVARNLIDLVNKVFVSPEQQKREAEQHELESAIQKILVVGLVISSALMLTGLALDLLLQREAPTNVPSIMEIFQRVVALQPSGFLALGLLVLIATPILRVVTSIIAFLYERDWRYALITFLVFLIVVSSILFGSG